MAAGALTFFGGALFLVRLAGPGWATAALVAALATVCAYAEAYPKLDPWTMAFRILPDPTNSSMPLRAIWPIVAVFAFWCVAASRPQWLGRRAFSAVVGALAGTSVLWSNDFGLPTAAGLLLLWAMTALPGRGARSGAVHAAIAVAAGAAAFLVLLNLLTLGHGGLWLRENFVDISGDQDWFYLVQFEDKVYELGQLPMVGFSLVLGLSALYLANRWREDRTRLGWLAIAVLVLINLMAAYLASIKGTGGLRYFAGALRVAYVAFPLTAFLLLEPFLKRALEILGKRAAAAGGAKAAAATAAAAVTVFLAQAEVAQPIGAQGEIAVPELGGIVSSHYGPAVEAGRMIRAEAEAKGWGPGERVFSAYSSDVAAIAGAVQPARQDYLIHALGARNRAAFFSAFENGDHPYAATLNPQTVGWHLWNERASWPFFRSLYARYDAVRGLGMTLLWKKRAEPRPELETPLSCEALREGDGWVAVITGGVGTAPLLSEVAIEYSVFVRSSGVPIIGSTGVVQATERDSALVRGIGHSGLRSFSLPVGETRAEFPVVHGPGSRSEVGLKALPGDRASLTVTGCWARALYPAADLEPAREPYAPVKTQAWTFRMPMASETEALADPVLVVVQPSLNLDPVRIGDEIASECFGTRRILSVDWLNQWRVGYLVDGRGLDPGSCGGLAGVVFRPAE